MTAPQQQEQEQQQQQQPERTMQMEISLSFHHAQAKQITDPEPAPNAEHKAVCRMPLNPAAAEVPLHIASPTGSDGNSSTNELIIIDNILLCKAHRSEVCKECKVNLSDQNLMTRQLQANNSQFPPPHPGMNKAINDLKEAGNEAFRKKSYAHALALYSQALMISHQRPVWDPAGLLVDETSKLLSNRSACLIGMERYAEALWDAEYVTRVQANWSKGWFRKGKALFGLERYAEAIEALEMALAYEDGPETRATLEQARKRV
ncbi:TPR-like protein [Ramicandelaber brevisporus]|nr:TPR-like protein [Ramicandelaber brevisporus]